MMDRKAAARSSRSSTPATTSTPRRSCCANPTARRRKSPRRSPRSSACCAPPAPPPLAVSRSEAERLRFWSGRKNAFPAAGRISPDYYCMDGTIPRKNARADAQGHRADGAHIRAAVHERVSRRRRQPAPADPVRRQPRGDWRARRPLRRRDPRAVRAAGRHHHRRARRRGGEDQFDVRAVLAGRARGVLRRQARLRSARAAQSRQGHPDAGALRRVWPACTCDRGRLPHPELPRF